jgi:hypothetical protein
VFKSTSIRNYFDDQHVSNEIYEASTHIGSFANSRMTYTRFVFISSVIDYDIDYVVNALESSIQNVYQHTVPLAPDESMNPLKIRNMVHHFFLMCKPHPNGLLSTSLADENQIVLAVRLRRRTVEDVDKPALRRVKEPALHRSDFTTPPKKSTTELIMDMTNRISEDIAPYIGEYKNVFFTAFSIVLKIKSNKTATWAHI